MKSVVKIGLKRDILFCAHASEYVRNLICTQLIRKQLQKFMSNLERIVNDVNCISSKRFEENKSMKERLANETEV